MARSDAQVLSYLEECDDWAHSADLRGDAVVFLQARMIVLINELRQRIDGARAAELAVAEDLMTAFLDRFRATGSVSTPVMRKWWHDEIARRRREIARG